MDGYKLKVSMCSPIPGKFFEVWQSEDSAWTYLITFNKKGLLFVWQTGMLKYSQSRDFVQHRMDLLEMCRFFGHTEKDL